MSFPPYRARGPFIAPFSMKACVLVYLTMQPARTITLYLDKRAFNQALDIGDEKNIWLYLFDKAGNVLQQIDGKFTTEKGEALRSAIVKAGQ